MLDATTPRAILWIWPPVLLLPLLPYPTGIADWAMLVFRRSRLWSERASLTVLTSRDRWRCTGSARTVFMASKPPAPLTAALLRRLRPTIVSTSTYGDL